MFRVFRFKIEKPAEEVAPLIATFLYHEDWCEWQVHNGKWQIGHGNKCWLRTAGPYLALSYRYRMSAEEIDTIASFLTELGATEIDKPPAV